MPPVGWNGSCSRKVGSVLDKGQVTQTWQHQHCPQIFTNITNINILQWIRAHFYHSFPLWEKCIYAKILISTRGGNHAVFFPDFCLSSKFTLCQTQTFCTTSNKSWRGALTRRRKDSGSNAYFVFLQWSCLLWSAKLTPINSLWKQAVENSKELIISSELMLHGSTLF